jgi:hypothetical protein
MCRIQEYDIEDVLKMIKGSKAMDRNEIPIKLWRSFRDITIVVQPYLPIEQDTQ